MIINVFWSLSNFSWWKEQPVFPDEVSEDHFSFRGLTEFHYFRVDGCVFENMQTGGRARCLGGLFLALLKVTGLNLWQVDESSVSDL